MSFLDWFLIISVAAAVTSLIYLYETSDSNNPTNSISSINSDSITSINSGNLALLTGIQNQASRLINECLIFEDRRQFNETLKQLGSSLQANARARPWSSKSDLIRNLDKILGRETAYLLGHKLGEGKADFYSRLPVRTRYAEAFNLCDDAFHATLNGHWNEALSLLNRALAIDSHYEYALNKKAECLLALGLGAEALETIQQSTLQADSSTESRIKQASVLAEIGRREEAMACMDIVLSHEITDAKVLLDAALVMRHLSLWSEAARLCDAASSAYRNEHLMCDRNESFFFLIEDVRPTINPSD